MDKENHVKDPENQRIIDRMKEEIDCALGSDTWNKITSDNCPNGDMDNQQLSVAMWSLLEKFDQLADSKTAKRVFSEVKHALKHSDFEWTREMFLQYNDIDRFAEAVLNDSMEHLQRCVEYNELFYDQPIDKEALEYARSIETLFYGKRFGNKIIATAIPYRLIDFLKTEDIRMKRYYMCHCQFARESIISEKTVSKTMCYCSLGHTKVFWEAALDTKLEGDVLHSALGGDLLCQFVIYLPDEIMEKYVKG
ncbi:hypothetical protein CDQ84_16085 [Clostridium thermosuccinogenes]|jgi:hypothetical protein|uniref:L-2-amino-thiazoline-4-carboxylic acid hydrolase n=1 Tax=Clostridium thermosuccinogenes TaxID=84032 RepID=A0A2K2F8Q3_9CLOT|nr:hypothetical protein [Pseudoclostridium thermosuccinogenes]AUS97109.1 hypothetical protein CDO33_12065 [Pseudoclostridium thermosuccinogenes]PNT95127.1 hypothetical protein CDQ85_15945 [Pseudoclostridium thermosuccinogenes]PNT95963.1 hypothetical protein CDQ84_16085 [Pseudoclostridium thermosuccinogenes]